MTKLQLKHDPSSITKWNFRENKEIERSSTKDISSKTKKHQRREMKQERKFAIF